MRMLFRIILSLAGLGGRKRRRPEAPAPRRRRYLKRATVAIGTLAMAAGIGMVSIGMYDYLESGEASVQEPPAALSHRNDPGSIYDRPVVQVAPTPAPTVTAAPTEAPTPTPAPAVNVPPPPPLRDRPYRMVIDKINVNAGVYTYGLDENQIPEVPLNAWDVAWYNFSAQPGTGSNAVFAAHVTWDGPAVFYNLDALVLGDEVRLIADDGTEIVYRVTESFLVDPNDPASLSVMHATDEDILTLITCGGTPYYIGGQFGYDYTDRQIVRAELVEIREA